MEENRREEEEGREMQISITAASAASVFPGFRFSPTDEELLQYYLKKKMEGSDKCVEIIPEVDFCRHEPWDLPGRSIIQSDNEWFFFSARGRKYPNGSQSRRATESGYWKATGKERNVKSGSNVIGTKRTLVFHTGRAPKGERTEWIMHEYCMDSTSQDSMVVCRLRRNSDFHLNENPRRRPQDSQISTRQACLRDGAGDESCSKEGTCSHNSQYVEQNASDESLQHGSTNFDKFYDGDGEEEWFADIMKDDIVKLDESSLINSTISPESLPVVRETEEVQVKPNRSVPSQGTAHRRIRLRRQRVQVKPFEARERCCVDQVSRSLSLVLVFVILFTLFVIFLSCQVKTFRSVCLCPIINDG